MKQLILIATFFTVADQSLARQKTELPPLNAAVLKFCETKEGKRVGGGECSHLANEALRVAGAEFTQVGADGKHIPDSPSSGDYVWGKSIKTFTFDSKANKAVDSDPKQKCLPGDILQFRDVKCPTGTFPHHTAIVRTVDDAGNVTGVYQQNVHTAKTGDDRVVQKGSLQPLKITAGRIMVYRPEQATNPFPMQFTWANCTKSKTIEFTFCGKKEKLEAANTSSGYSIVWASKGADTVTVDGTTYALMTRKHYEFYSMPEGKIGLRELR